MTDRRKHLAYFIKMVDKEKGLKYLQELNEIEWPL